LYEMEIAGYEREHGVEVTRLTDDQAVLVKDDRVEVVTTENPFPKCSS